MMRMFSYCHTLAAGLSSARPKRNAGGQPELLKVVLTQKGKFLY
jgi:hypothetical protein